MPQPNQPRRLQNAKAPGFLTLKRHSSTIRTSFFAALFAAFGLLFPFAGAEGTGVGRRVACRRLRSKAGFYHSKQEEDSYRGT